MIPYEQNISPENQALIVDAFQKAGLNTSTNTHAQDIHTVMAYTMNTQMMGGCQIQCMTESVISSAYRMAIMGVVLDKPVRLPVELLQAIAARKNAHLISHTVSKLAMSEPL